MMENKENENKENILVDNKLTNDEFKSLDKLEDPFTEYINSTNNQQPYKNIKRCIGCIVVKMDMLYFNANLSTLKCLYANFYPVQMEQKSFEMPYDTVKIIGYSELFDELEEGCKIPEYNFTFFMLPSGSVTICKVERIRY
jgi:hypothetical protein